MAKLKGTCGKVQALDGWKFQDCKDNFVTLVRTKVKGDWKVDYQGDDIPKDYYVSAEYHEPRRGMWEITSYDPVGGHSGYKAQFYNNEEKAAAELVCLARGDEEWEASLLRNVTPLKASEAAKKELDKCRWESGTPPYLPWHNR